MPSRDFSTSRDLFSSSTASACRFSRKSGCVTEWLPISTPIAGSRATSPSRACVADASCRTLDHACCNEQVGWNFVLGKNRRGVRENTLPAVVERNRKIAGRSVAVCNLGRGHEPKSKLLREFDVPAKPLRRTIVDAKIRLSDRVIAKQATLRLCVVGAERTQGPASRSTFAPSRGVHAASADLQFPFPLTNRQVLADDGP